MNKLLLASLISTSVSLLASADPTPPTPPGPPTIRPRTDACQVKGVPLFEIDRMDGSRAVSMTKLYETGAWTVQRTNADGSSLPLASGCTTATMTTTPIHVLLATAPWNHEHPIHCMIATSAFVSYYAEGKPLYTERVCNSDVLDATSASALADIVKLVDRATVTRRDLSTYKGKP